MILKRLYFEKIKFTTFTQFVFELIFNLLRDSIQCEFKTFIDDSTNLFRLLAYYYFWMNRK
jgi:hypothetical protein